MTALQHRLLLTLSDGREYTIGDLCLKHPEHINRLRLAMRVLLGMGMVRKRGRGLLFYAIAPLGKEYLMQRVN